MKLQEAIMIASAVYNRLRPHCKQLEVAGSVRRKKPEVNDIDFVLIPSNPGSYPTRLTSWGRRSRMGRS